MRTRSSARGATSPTRWSTVTTATGLYEQFAGLLRPRAARDRRDRAEPPDRRRPVARARARPRSAQVVKQADVLMLHHLVPDEVAAGLPRAEPRVLRAPHGTRQLAVAGDPRLALGPRRPADERALEPLGIAATPRPRRPHRHHGGRPAPRHDGRRLAGADVPGFAGIRPGSTALEIDRRLHEHMARAGGPCDLPGHSSAGTDRTRCCRGPGGSARSCPAGRCAGCATDGRDHPLVATSR